MKKDIEEFIASTLREAGIAEEEFEQKVAEGHEVFVDPESRKAALHAMLITLTEGLDKYEQVKDRMSTADSINFLKRWNLAFETYEVAKALDEEMRAEQ